LPSVYFVQDYESGFVPEKESEQRTRIIESYHAADVLIVTSRWLQEKLAQHGRESVVIPVGCDSRVFYPRLDGPHADPNPGPAHRERILVQARPFAPWRGFRNAVEVLNRLIRRRQDVDVVFFGSTDDELATAALPFPYRNAGVIVDRHAVARLYSSSDVLFDPSVYQAFGLPGLEAMACGVPAVLPKQGGAGEYAEHDRNALLVDSSDRDGQVESIERLLDDPTLRARLVGHGLATASRFTLEAMMRGHEAVYAKHGAV
jgi:glycosyltransferase involved in cell wall biosynthesis